MNNWFNLKVKLRNVNWKILCVFKLKYLFVLFVFKLDKR